MRTLCLRNVPDDVVTRLEQLAVRDGLSVSALAVRELAMASRRADNPDLVDRLPDHQMTVESLLGDLDAGRANR